MEILEYFFEMVQYPFSIFFSTHLQTINPSMTVSQKERRAGNSLQHKNEFLVSITEIQGWQYNVNKQFVRGLKASSHLFWIHKNATEGTIIYRINGSTV